MTKTLLLADDSVTMQKVVGITFANEDVHLVTVDNGDAALERAVEITPDVVLADVGMPGLNGYELCAAIKAEPTLRNVKVILLTGTFDTYDETRAREVGADAHVSKPFEAQALVDQVHALLNAPSARPTAASAPVAVPSRTPRLPDLSELEPPPLDFDPLEMDMDSASELEPSFDTGVDDLPARSPRPGDPTRPTDADDMPDLYEAGHKTTLLSADDLLEPPPVPQSLAPPRTPPAARPIPTPAPRAPQPPPPPARPPVAPRAMPDTNLKTTLMPPALDEDLFPADVDLFGPDPKGFGSSDADSSGVFGEPDEVEAPAPKPRASGASASPQRPAAFGETLLRDFPPLEGLPDLEADAEQHPEPAKPRSGPPSWLTPAAQPPEMEDDDEGDELELSSAEEEIPWAEPLESDEPATPNYFREPPRQSPVAPPPPAPRRPEPVAAARPAPPAPIAPAAPPPAPAITLDPDKVNDAIEKLAWEAFGPLAETIVREVVKQVESIAWETIPQIAERLVQEEIERLKREKE